MELKLNKEPVFINEVIYDGQTEQGVEFNYVLPDYYPDIYKILKCTLFPSIVSYSVSGSQLFCDGVVCIRVMYLSENSGSINCVEQRYTYSKTIELARNAEQATVSITPKTDYCNCRAVSDRRIDVRGAVSCKVRVTSIRRDEIISGAEGLEEKKREIIYCGGKIAASRQFTLREDIETGMGKGAISGIIHTDTFTSINDTKIIANKVVVKGEVRVKSLYIVRNGDEEETEVMEASVPVSQIIEADGISERHSCYAALSVMGCSLEIKQNENGENRLFGCDLTLDCSVTANSEDTVSVLTDVYSTQYDTSFIKSPLKIEFAPQIISRQLSHKTTIECKDGVLQEVYDCRCDLSNIICRTDSDGGMTVSGHLGIQAIGRLTMGTPVFLEKSETFELPAEISGMSENAAIDHNLQISDVSFSISGDDNVEIRIMMSLNGCVYNTRTIDVISNIEVDCEKPKLRDNDYALKMYYAEADEEVWNIAKQYNTSADAVMSENELDSEILAAPCMLLIPLA